MSKLAQLRQQIDIQSDLRKWSGDPAEAGGKLVLNALGEQDLPAREEGGQPAPFFLQPVVLHFDDDRGHPLGDRCRVLAHQLLTLVISDDLILLLRFEVGRVLRGCGQRPAVGQKLVLILDQPLKLLSLLFLAAKKVGPQLLLGHNSNKELGRAMNWLGKRELVEIPVIGPFMRKVPIHPVDREAADLEAFRTAIRILQSGNILGIFPEGTRSLDGALKPVREGAGVLALHSGAPVMPVAVIDSDLAWPKGHLLPRWGKHVTVRWGRPFLVRAQVVPSSDSGEMPAVRYACRSALACPAALGA